MKAIRTAAIVVIVVILGSWAMIRTLTVSVPVGMVGVRTQEYGVFGKKGIVPEDFGPGWHRDFGPIDSWTFFDSTVQTLEMTRIEDQGSQRGRDDVQVQSADGYAVSVDVTVKYRIQQGKAYKPFVLPQQDPRYYDSCLKTYNVPELIRGPVTLSPWVLADAAHEDRTALKASLDPKVEPRDEAPGADIPWRSAR